MKNSNKSGNVFKATIWYLLCDFITRGISFVTMPVFTRMMTPSEIGKYSIMSTWISIFSVIVTLNLIQSVFLAKYDYKKDYQGFISTVASLGMFSATICYMVIIPFREQVAKLLQLEVYAIDIMAIHLIFCQMIGILLAKYRATLDYKKSVALTLGTISIITISSIVCTLCFPDALKGRIIGTYVTTIIINILIYAFFLYKYKSFKIEYCRYAVAICLPLIIHNLAGNIIHSSDRIMIGQLCSDEEAGLYSVAYACAMFANVIRNSMNSAWTPWVFEKINVNEIENIKRTSYVYLIVFLILCLGIIYLAPELLLILGGELYMSAVYIVPPVVSAYIFSMVYSMYADIEQYYKKQNYFAAVAAICALLNIVLNFMLLPLYGYIAAAYTTLICSALECYLHYLNVRKMGMHKIYNTQYNLLILISVLIISAVATLVYKNDVIRYILISVGIIGMIIFSLYKRDKIMILIKNSIRN